MYRLSHRFITSSAKLPLEVLLHVICVVVFPQVVIDGPLLHRVKVEESMWSVDKASRHIYINLEKQKEIMWKSVIQGEEGIDLTKVDTTRDISEFDQEAQAAIQRVTFDHQMKMMGKPTSSEQVSLFACLHYVLFRS